MLQFCSAAVLALVLLPSAALAQGVEQTIRDRLGQFQAAFNKADSAMIAQMHTADAVVLPPGEPPVEGRDAIAGEFKTAFEEGVGDLTVVPVEIVVRDDLAFTRASISFSSPDRGGSRVRRDGKGIIVWTRDDGTWRMQRDIWNMNAH